MTTPQVADASLDETTDWLSQRERGTLFALRALMFWATVLGRLPTKLLVACIALYYAVFDRSAVSASRDWLARVHGRPATFGEVYRHIRYFAQVTLDRLFLVQGKTDAFRFTRDGNEHLKELARTKRGALLLGAHLGSFAAMRASSKKEQFPVNIVGYFENARMINALLREVAPDFDGRVIHAGGDPINLALNLKECIGKGNMVAILGDRVGLNDKMVEVDFFGAKTVFPTAPFLIAKALKCPIYLVFGLYREPNQYALFCEPFVERVELPRKHRDEALQTMVQQFADRLEAKCRIAPYNWFNFYDFWKQS